MGYINIWRAGLARTQQFTWELAVPLPGKGGKAEPRLQSSRRAPRWRRTTATGQTSALHEGLGWAQTLPGRDLPAPGEGQGRHSRGVLKERRGRVRRGQGWFQSRSSIVGSSRPREGSGSERTPAAGSGAPGQMLLRPVMCRGASSHVASKSKAAGKSLSTLQEQLIWRTCERPWREPGSGGLAPSWRGDGAAARRGG